MTWDLFHYARRRKWLTIKIIKHDDDGSKENPGRADGACVLNQNRMQIVRTCRWLWIARQDGWLDKGPTNSHGVRSVWYASGFQLTIPMEHL